MKISPIIEVDELLKIYKNSDVMIFDVSNNKNAKTNYEMEHIEDHIFINLIENAPFNTGKKKLYEGVQGNLFAFACKLSWDNGNQGFVSFISKTKLMENYNKTLGAVNVFDQGMVIEPRQALKLIKQYFPELI
jgi:hypothetical protein